MFSLPKWNRACQAFFFRNFTSFLHNWHVNLFEGMIQPLLYLFCFGYFMGQWFDITAVHSYFDYTYIGILTAISMSVAVYEATHLLRHQILNPNFKGYFSSLPIRITDLLVGGFAWCVFKSFLFTVAFMLIGSWLGSQSLMQYLAVLVLSLCISIFYTSLVYFICVFVRNVQGLENNTIYLVLPIFLFSGTFFAVDVLPRIMREIFEYQPLGFSIHLLRNKELMGWTLLDLSILLGFLLLSGLLLSWALPRLQQRYLQLQKE